MTNPSKEQLITIAKEKLQALTQEQLQTLLDHMVAGDSLICKFCGKVYTWESARNTTVWAGNQQIACKQCWEDHK